MVTDFKATQFLHVPCLMNSMKLSSYYTSDIEDTIMTKTNSCQRRCLRGTDTAQKAFRMGFPMTQLYLVFLFIPLGSSGCQWHLPLFQSGTFERWVLHTEFGRDSVKSGVWEMILKGKQPSTDGQHSHAKPLAGEQATNSAHQACTRLLCHFRSRCWWQFYPYDWTRWASIPDLL